MALICARICKVIASVHTAITEFRLNIQYSYLVIDVYPISNQKHPRCKKGWPRTKQALLKKM